MPSSHFEQLAMNLAVNAREAMPDGGKLSFELKQLELNAGEHGVAKDGNYVVFSVTDQGHGIPHDILPHLFEPSFTTKRTGTGLGLATCHSVVSQLGGGVKVETAAGRGSTFRFFLPASSYSSKTEQVLGSIERLSQVLVVDDERAVRETTSRILQTAGFRVRTAGTLLEARSILEDPSACIDALVTDVVLSGERGTDLLASCRSHRPEAPIVVMSGYTPDPNAATMLEKHGANFLPKPFRAEQLLAALGVSPHRSPQPARPNGAP